MPTRFVVALLAALTLLAFAGCGGSSGSSSTATTSPAVAEEPVAAGGGAQSPQQTVLQWWHDVQVNDPEDALPLYAVAPTLPNLAGQFNFVAGKLEGKVSIVSVKKKGDRTLVRVRRQAGPGEAKEVTLRLSKEGGTWKLLDTRFLDEMVAELQAAEAAEAGG